MSLQHALAFTAVLTVAISAVLPRELDAQLERRDSRPLARIAAKIHCVGKAPDPCVGVMTQEDSIQRFEIELQIRDSTTELGLPNAVVRFHPTSGTIVGDSARSVGPNGTVRAIWMRPQGNSAVGIGVDARPVTDSDSLYSAVRYVRISPPPATAATLLRIAPTHTFPFAGFENTTLREPMIVEILKASHNSDTIGTPITTAGECQIHRIVFRGSAGTMTPDTAVPEVYSASPSGTPDSESRLGCRAEAEWSIGAGAGPREAQVRLIPGTGYKQVDQKPMRWNVRSRALPRFVLGGLLRIDRRYEGRDDGDAVTYRVERTRNGTTIAFDSIDPGTVTYKESEVYSTGVMVGVASAIPSRATDWLTVVAGVDLTSPLDHQYLGLSILRLFDQPETLPVDFAALAHFGKVDVLDRPSDCKLQRSRVAGAEPCATNGDRVFRGVAFMFSIDAGTLLSEAIKKLGT